MEYEFRSSFHSAIERIVNIIKSYAKDFHSHRQTRPYQRWKHDSVCKLTPIARISISLVTMRTAKRIRRRIIKRATTRRERRKPSTCKRALGTGATGMGYRFSFVSSIINIRFIPDRWQMLLARKRWNDSVKSERQTREEESAGSKKASTFVDSDFEFILFLIFGSDCRTMLTLLLLLLVEIC